MNQLEWAITGAAIGAMIGWAIGIAMRQRAFKTAFKKYGPAPQSLTVFLNQELQMFDRLENKEVAEREMSNLCEQKRQLLSSGRVGWSEMDTEELIASVGVRHSSSLVKQ